MRSQLFFGAALITLLISCGGGTKGSPQSTTPTVATSLSYSDPAGTDFRLVRNPSLSTATHLVLDLVGPEQTRSRGVVIALQVDGTKARWTKVQPSDAEWAFSPVFTAPQAGLKTRVAGGELQAGAFQKGISQPVVNGATPLLRIALDLVPDQKPGSLTLASVADRCLLVPERSDEPMKPVAIALGSLRAE